MGAGEVELVPEQMHQEGPGLDGGAAARNERRSARRTSDCTYALRALLGRHVTVRGFWPNRRGTGKGSLAVPAASHDAPGLRIHIKEWSGVPLRS